MSLRPPPPPYSNSSSVVLETDFPLVLPPITNPGASKVSRSSSRERTAAGGGSLGRGGGPMPSATPAPEWQYEAVSSSRTNGSTMRMSYMAAPQRPMVVVQRSSSLRRACSDPDPSLPPPHDDDSERQPLNPKKKQQIAIVQSGSTQSSSATTSDYHSGDERNSSNVVSSCEKSDRLLLQPPPQRSQRHRKSDDDEMSGGARCCFGFLVAVAQILLHGSLGLVLYWLFMFHRRPGQTWPFAWKEDPQIEFNLHPALMILGFIYFMGQAMLMYRTCRCCRRIWNKLLHTVFHLAAIPCIAVGFIAVLDYHELRRGGDGLPAPIPNFYSLHSWMGLATMGLFALQFFVGFFSFLLLLCCESATASFRASLVPIHSAFGISTFVMAVATSCSGLTQKAFFTLSTAYSKWVDKVSDRNFSPVNALAGLEGISNDYTAEQFEESLVINTLGAALVALVFVMPVVLLFPKFRVRPRQVVTVTSSGHHHDRYA